MIKNYKCSSCMVSFSKIIDFNYHWLDCGQSSQEDRDYEWMKKEVGAPNLREKLINQGLIKPLSQSLINDAQSKEISSYSDVEMAKSNPSIDGKSNDHWLMSNTASKEKNMVKCPNCQSMVRQDRLRTHLAKVHIKPDLESHKSGLNHTQQIGAGKSQNLQDRINNNQTTAFVLKNDAPVSVNYVNVINKKVKVKSVRRGLANLQSGNIAENIPAAKFGEENGAILKEEEVNGVKVRYEQALCSCNGDNERCMRCDGTGFYAKKIVETPDREQNSPIIRSVVRRKFGSNLESNFSNDLRGGDYGIRENGRFNSNPLYDDHN